MGEQVGRTKKHHLEQFESVRLWTAELSKGSELTGEAYQRRLALYCEKVGMNPDQLLKQSEKEAYIQLKEIIDSMQGQFQVSYIKSLEKGPRSFYRYHGKSPLPRIKYDRKKGSRKKEEKGEERVITLEELEAVLWDSTPRVRSMISLLSLSGVRIGALGDVKGAFGLRLKDLPELDLDKLKFNVEPGMIKVPESLSKTGSSYLTFLSSQGCKFLLEYLRARKDSGEKLSGDSPVIKGINQKTKGTDFVTTKAISADIRRALRKKGVTIRPYGLRVFLSQALSIAEAKGKITESQSKYIFGHKGSMLDHYRYSGKTLNEEMISQLREAYRGIEPLISIRGNPSDNNPTYDLSVRGHIEDSIKSFISEVPGLKEKIDDKEELIEKIISFLKAEDYYSELSPNRIYNQTYHYLGAFVWGSMEEFVQEIEDNIHRTWNNARGSTGPKPTCQVCSGTGLQTDNIGIVHKCPVCEGSGTWTKPSG